MVRENCLLSTAEAGPWQTRHAEAEPEVICILCIISIHMSFFVLGTIWKHGSCSSWRGTTTVQIVHLLHLLIGTHTCTRACVRPIRAARSLMPLHGPVCHPVEKEDISQIQLQQQLSLHSVPSACFIWSLQCPNLPVIGCAQSILMQDSQGRDSFTKTCFSVHGTSCAASPVLWSSKEACSEDQGTIVSRRWSTHHNGHVFRPLQSEHDFWFNMKLSL